VGARARRAARKCKENNEARVDALAAARATAATVCGNLPRATAGLPPPAARADASRSRRRAILRAVMGRRGRCGSDASLLGCGPAKMKRI